MKFLQLKPSVLTLAFLLAFVSVTNQSCGVTIPATAKSTINTLASTLPLFMGKAKGVLTPELSKQADNILSMITEAAKLTNSSGSTRIASLLNTLGLQQFKPFLDMWKNKGSLDQNSINTAVTGVNKTIGALKRAVK